MTIARENPGFFMHSTIPIDYLKTANQILNLIPVRFGNQQLELALKNWINGSKNNSINNGTTLRSLIYHYLNFPSKDWEFEILKLFKTK